MKLTENMLRKMIQEERSKLKSKKKPRINEAPRERYDLDYAGEVLGEALENYILAAKFEDHVAGGDIRYAISQAEMFVEEWFETYKGMYLVSRLSR